MAETNCICAHCGAAFSYVKVKGFRKYCSELCAYAVALERAKARGYVRAPGVRPVEDARIARIRASRDYRKCLGCGMEYVANLSTKQRASRNRDAQQKYCSAECKSKHTAERPPRFSRVLHKVCVCCGAEWFVRASVDPGHSFCRSCSKGVEFYDRATVDWSKIVCVVCGGKFSTDWRQGRPPKYCPVCGPLAKMDTLTRHRRASKARRKAIEKAANAERFDPFEVFDRDRWTCQLCGRKTPKSKRGAYDDDAPELDHIVPLSKGGEHSRRNTQCACRSCNAAKSDTARGQINLF